MGLTLPPWGRNGHCPAPACPEQPCCLRGGKRKMRRKKPNAYICVGFLLSLLCCAQTPCSLLDCLGSASTSLLCFQWAQLPGAVQGSLLWSAFCLQQYPMERDTGEFSLDIKHVYAHTCLQTKIQNFNSVIQAHDFVLIRDLCGHSSIIITSFLNFFGF